MIIIVLEQRIANGQIVKPKKWVDLDLSLFGLSFRHGDHVDYSAAWLTPMD